MITCYKCDHYFVTWDKDAPHGCRGMGFKSRLMPSIVVQKYSNGMKCELFKEKIRGHTKLKSIDHKSRY